MSMHANDELSDFYHYLTDRITSGAANFSPEEAVDAWRSQLPQEQDDAETVVALRQAIAQLEAGDRGVPLAEFDAAFRKRHGLTGDP